MSELVEAAARNNAVWCDAVCRTHGIVGEFGPDRWTSRSRTPPFYPDAITLAPGASAGPIVERIERTAPGCSVKDSFATLDLAPHGFRVLFDAVWIGFDAAHSARTERAGGPFSTVTTSGVLERWVRAWAHGEPAPSVFLPSLLELDDVRVFGAFAGDDVVAGFVANRAHDCVGVSNTFSREGPIAWGPSLATVHRAWPGLPVVGYESGPDLDHALGQGATPLGPLRVWAAP
jgi:hypothetical protein